MAYSKQFTLPASVSSSTHKIAVSVVDRYGNEFGTKVLNESISSSVAAVLNSPVNNNTVLIPCVFSWNAVEGADSYVWQLARDAQFNDLVCSRETTQPQFFSGLQTNLKNNTDYYWRVRTRKANAVDVWSETRKLTSKKFGISSPANNASAVSLTPSFNWDYVSPTAAYTLEISTANDFSTTKLKQNVSTNSFTVPAGILLSSTAYYARVSVSDGIVQATSETIIFTTQDIAIPVPVLTKPETGSTVNGTSIEVCWAQQPSNGFRAELSKDPAFPARGTTIKTVDAYTYCTSFDALTAGTYYVRVKATTNNGLTEASAVSNVVLNGNTAIDELNYGHLKCYIRSGNPTTNELIILSNTAFDSKIQLTNITGSVLLNKDLLINEGENRILINGGFPKGVYLLTVIFNNKTISHKIIN